MKVVRRFYDNEICYPLEKQVSPELATHSAIALTDDGKVMRTPDGFLAVTISKIKRHPEVFGTLSSGAVYRANSQEEVEAFHVHWGRKVNEGDKL